MNSTYCQSQAYNWTVANSLKNYADAQRYLNNLCQNNCQMPAGAVCADRPSTPPINHHPPVTPPPSPPPTSINQWFNTGSGGLPDDCASLQTIYTNAKANGDYATSMEAAAKLTIAKCSVPNEVLPANGDNSTFNCDVAYRIYYDQIGMFNEASRQEAYQSLVANNCPQVSAGNGPAPFDCAGTQKQYIDALNNGQPVNDLYHLLVINGCTVPVTPSSVCDTYNRQFNSAYTAKDVTAMQAAVARLIQANCTPPPPSEWNPATNQPVYPETPQQAACDLLQAQYVEIQGGGGDTRAIVSQMCANNCDMPAGTSCGPPVNPCTGEQSLTLVDYLISLPLSGIKDDPLLAVGLAAAGGLASAITVTVFVPEAGRYVRIPAAVAGAYGGLIVNGILDNYGFIQNAEKDGIVFGTLVTGLGAVHGLYQSIHQTTEKFLKTELGGVFGEITYKAAEFVFQGGPIGWVSDIVWGDRTWTTAGYDKAKCDANCGNPKLSSTERKLCKIGARLDLKF